MYLGVTGYNFPPKIVFLSLKIHFVLPPNLDTEKVPHFMAFHLGLLCYSLPMYPIRGFVPERVKQDFLIERSCILNMRSSSSLLVF